MNFSRSRSRLYNKTDVFDHWPIEALGHNTDSVSYFTIIILRDCYLIILY